MKYIIIKSLIVQFFRALGYVALNYLWVIMESIVQVHDNSNENKEVGYMHVHASVLKPLKNKQQTGADHKEESIRRTDYTTTATPLSVAPASPPVGSVTMDRISPAVVVEVAVLLDKTACSIAFPANLIVALANSPRITVDSPVPCEAPGAGGVTVTGASAHT